MEAFKDGLLEGAGFVLMVVFCYQVSKTVMQIKRQIQGMFADKDDGLELYSDEPNMRSMGSEIDEIEDHFGVEVREAKDTVSYETGAETEPETEEVKPVTMGDFGF